MDRKKLVFGSKKAFEPFPIPFQRAPKFAQRTVFGAFFNGFSSNSWCVGVLWDIWSYEFGVQREDLKNFPPKNDVKSLETREETCVRLWRPLLLWII